MLNLAQTAIQKFIGGNTESIRTTFTGKHGKYAKSLRKWVEGNPRYIQADHSASVMIGNIALFVDWSDKAVTISKFDLTEEFDPSQETDVENGHDYIQGQLL